MKFVPSTLPKANMHYYCAERTLTVLSISNDKANNNTLSTTKEDRDEVFVEHDFSDFKYLGSFYHVAGLKAVKKLLHVPFNQVKLFGETCTSQINMVLIFFSYIQMQECKNLAVN